MKLKSVEKVLVSKYNKLLLLSCLFLIATSCIQDLKKKSNSATNSGAGLNESVTVSYSSLALTESLTNTGQFTQTINLSLNAGSFASNLAPHYNLANLPIGLTSSLVKVSSRTAILTILGQATTHESVNSTNLQFSLSDSAVSGFLQASAADVQGKNQVFSLNFINPAKLLYSATSFLENTDNLGLVTQTRTITLTGDTFSFNLAGDYFFSNVPAGLTGNLERLTDTQILLSFTGNALAHGTNDSIVNISLTFLNTAFNYNFSKSRHQ